MINAMIMKVKTYIPYKGYITESNKFNSVDCYTRKTYDYGNNKYNQVNCRQSFLFFLSIENTSLFVMTGFNNWRG